MSVRDGLDDGRAEAFAVADPVRAESLEWPEEHVCCVSRHCVPGVGRRQDSTGWRLVW